MHSMNTLANEKLDTNQIDDEYFLDLSVLIAPSQVQL